jgi:predicted nucleic acid-binding protein
MPIVSLKGLKLPKRAMFLRALDLYAENAMDFVNALAIAQMEAWQVTEVYSLDGHFDLVDGIRRIEP